MPFKGFRSRPGTSSSQKAEELRKSPSKNGDNTYKPSHRREDSFKRLSLRLTRSNGEAFEPLFTHEPDAIHGENGPAEAESAPMKTSLPTPEEDNDDAPLNISESAETKEGVEPVDNKPDLKPARSQSQRFSLLRFRHASDPQLSARFKGTPVEEAAPPTIITTAPTSLGLDEAVKPAKRPNLFKRSTSPFKRSRLSGEESRISTGGVIRPSPVVTPATSNFGDHVTFHEPQRPHDKLNSAPPAYGDDSLSSLAIPVSRLSESSKSDASSGENRVYAQTTTTHTMVTTTTFFKLKKKKKDRGHLFPLPERFPQTDSGPASTVATPLHSATPRKSMSPSRKSTNTVRYDPESEQKIPSNASPNSSIFALTNAPSGVTLPGVMMKESNLSMHSGHSTPSLPAAVPPRLGVRGRSNTMGSLRRSIDRGSDSNLQGNCAERTSISTAGRRSFGDLLTLPHRFRQNSAPPGRPMSNNSPSTPGSKSNSMQIARDSEPELVYPPREETDTPASYLEKLEGAVPKGTLATILCKSGDEFSKTCLRKYMRGFSYFGESIDMSVRKMLMEVELPKETQQIDRLLAGFADRYYECNPGIFTSTDETGIVAFSILLLHSDTHNKNNKRKMQKADYVKNTQGPVSVSGDVLECFYDNVCYTPFIHFEDEIAINSHRLAAPKLKKALMRSRSSEALRGPVDPYTLLLDNKLDFLRPSLKDVMDTEDHYNNVGPGKTLDSEGLHNAFINAAVLQIVSARSRPDAFMNQATINNPAEAQVGLISFRVAKVGLLWRKDQRKKKAKRPWQEWGAIMTDGQLYFFKDVSWVKKLMSQVESYDKQPYHNGPLVFNPPVTKFEPDALMGIDDTVALTDSSYKRHKNAFTFIKHGGFEEVFLANSEADMNDWIGKLNYATTFRTAGVRMKGLVGLNYEGRQIMPQDSQVSTATSENPKLQNKKVDPQVLWEILFYRRQLINEKISDLDERIAAAQKELDNLLRNARHLLILLPIQAKTRDAIVLAAGRMSAKLKWTRIELWRTKTHRDILARDLETETVSAFPAPNTRAASTTSPATKAPSIKTNVPPLDRSFTDTSIMTLSPISVSTQLGRKPSHTMLDRLKTHEVPTEGRRKSAGSLKVTSGTESTVDSNHARNDSPDLRHQPSIVSSLGHQGSFVTPVDGTEEQYLKEAGLIGVDGAIAKRPDTSGSERDRLSAVGASVELPRDHGARRSLHKSLRDGHIRESIQSHSPSHYRHKKGKESGSSVLQSDDGHTSHGENIELKRTAGSFILHGKKASVITMSSEWQAMSPEERMRLRKTAQEEAAESKKDGTDPELVIRDDKSETAIEEIKETAVGGYKSENAIRDEKSDIAISPYSLVTMDKPITRPERALDGIDTISVQSDTKTASFKTPTTDLFVDAESGHESTNEQSDMDETGKGKGRAKA